MKKCLVVTDLIVFVGHIQDVPVIGAEIDVAQGAVPLLDRSAGPEVGNDEPVEVDFTVHNLVLMGKHIKNLILGVHVQNFDKIVCEKPALLLLNLLELESVLPYTAHSLVGEATEAVCSQFASDFAAHNNQIGLFDVLADLNHSRALVELILGQDNPHLLVDLLGNMRVLIIRVTEW